MQTEQTDLDTTLSDDSVLAYLMSKPEFFVNNKDILPRLRIPHESGAAVSLIEKQVSVLRGKCAHLENSLRDFIAVARENENLHHRLHSLIQDVISAPALEDMVPLVQSSLMENFHADAVHLTLIATPPERASRKQGSVGATAGRGAKVKASPSSTAKAVPIEGLRIVGHTNRQLKLFKPLFDDGQTQCGMPGKEQLNFSVGKDQAQIASVAMIPLHHKRKLGVLMLTSRDERRFAAGKGVMFLNQLGDLLSRRIHSYGAIEKAATR